MQELKTTKIEKLVPGGRGLGRAPDGMVVLVFNALPGEEVAFYVTKRKKNHLEANAEQVLVASPDRIDPEEPEIFLSTSPWQILSSAKEDEYKQALVQETYYKLPEIKHPLPIASDHSQDYHYRNKMEFSFTETEAGELKLAFYKRGTRQKIPVTGSKLASEAINKVAKLVLQWLTKEQVSENSLKSVIIRSNQVGQAVAAIFIKEEYPFDEYPSAEFLTGLQVYYSNPRSPASVPTRLLYKQGQDYLFETVGDTNLKYGLLSFFQVNQPLFQQTLIDIADHIPQDSEIIDFYSGVGSISIPLHNKVSKATLIDNNEEAIKYAQENITLNQLTNFEAICSHSEKTTDLIHGEAIVILDPPRAGLHTNVIDRLLEVLPPKVIYLSCDLATQTRDLVLLQKSYKITYTKLYNYFPRTPHIESLCILERR